MKISELSCESGVSVASIKFFRREGLLPAGHATAATVVEYGEEHVQRLRLIKALTTLGGLSIAAVKDVLAAVDQAESPSGSLSAVSYALPVPVGERTADAPVIDDADAEAEVAALVAALVAAMDWQVSASSPHLRALAVALWEMKQLDAGYEPGELLTYAGLAADIARLDLERASAIEDPVALAGRAAVVLALSAPVLELLRRLAQEDQVRRWVRDSRGDRGVPT